MSKNVKVVMTRTTDVFVQLGERARISNNANARIFVSIHMNAFNGSARGLEVFIHNNSKASEALGRDAQNALLDAFDAPDRGVKRANFAVLRGTYRQSLSILTEVLFMDNARDADIFNRSNFVRLAAEAHYAFINKHANNGDTICLDPGHGGHDPGATGHGKREKDLVLAIALYTRDLLTGKKKVGQTDSPRNSAPSNSSGTFTSLSNSEKYSEISRAVREQGYTEAQLQRMLMAAGERLPRWGDDGKPGAETLAAIESFQSRHNLSSPSGSFFGRPGPSTMRKLVEVLPAFGRILRANTPYPRGADVTGIQRVVYQSGSGSYGPKTADGVRDFQRRARIGVDGVFGPQTRKAMFNL